MRRLRLLLLACLSCVLARPAQAQHSSESEIRRAVSAFYQAFNSHDFARAADFTTPDWAPTDTPDTMVVRLTGPTSAVVTVPSHLSTYVTPDGARHEQERQIRTFVLIKREQRWRIIQDHNTIVGRGGGPE